MEMKKLSLDQMREIYDLRMREDFPDNERRPFSGIAALFERGEYEGWGLYEEEALLAYAFLVREIWQEKACCLIDYIAVDRDRRGEGIGTCLLKELKKALAGADCVIGELELPLSGAHTRDEIFDIAEYFYRKMLPAHLVDRYLRIHR